eukprot:XP_011412357.1 PREDICTED: uncharacterized protein LOC105317411 isoform X1 [Crassostrea gigas]
MQVAVFFLVTFGSCAGVNVPFYEKFVQSMSTQFSPKVLKNIKLNLKLFFRELNEPPRHKRGVDMMPNSVRDFIHLIGSTNSDTAININSSLDYMATDFTTHVLPHLNRLLGKIRVLQENGADIGSQAQASISFVQDSLGKTVSYIDGTIVQRATN